MNNKILSAILIAGITVTGFASLSSADDTNTGSTESTTMNKTLRGERVALTDEQKAEREAAKVIFDKVKAGDELTTAEQTIYDEAKENGLMGKGKRGGGERGDRIELTDEQIAEREAIKAIFDKVKAGDELTEAEQTAYDNAKENGIMGHGKRGGGERCETEVK